MKIFSKIFRRGIEGKIVLSLFLIVLAVSMAFTFFNYNQQQKIFIEKNENESKVLLSLLEANFAQPLAELKLDDIKFMFNYVFQDPKIESGYIFDDQNQLLINGDNTGIYPQNIVLDSLTLLALSGNKKEMVVRYSENLMNISTAIIYNNRQVGFLCLNISLDGIKVKLVELRDRNILVSLMLIFVSVIISFFFSKKITRPLQKLTESISKTTSSGNYEERIEVKTGDEFQILADTYNEMLQNLNVMKIRLTQERDRAQKYLDIAGVIILVLDQLGNVVLINKNGLSVLGYEYSEIIGRNWFDEFYKEISINKTLKNTFNRIMNRDLRNKSYQFTLKTKNSSKLINWKYSSILNEKNENIGLLCAGEDVTEKKAAELELIKAKEAAETSVRLKSEFLAQMSHEIRTPVNTILNFSYLIKDETDNLIDNKFSNYYTSIELASKRLIGTIDSILNMSQLESGTYDANFNYIDLYDDIIVNLQKEFYQKALSKDLKLLLNKNTTNCNVYADQYSLTQALANLIDNAIKYTEKGKIILSIDNVEDDLIVSVIDTGIGMSDDYLPLLFNPFTQEEQGYSRSFEGNGLGLSLVKSYCDINNAIISVTSVKEKGTTFKLLLKKQNVNTNLSSSRRVV